MTMANEPAWLCHARSLSPDIRTFPAADIVISIMADRGGRAMTRQLMSSYPHVRVTAVTTGQRGRRAACRNLPPIGSQSR